MPGGDRIGPWGAGPRTGRAMGLCTGHPFPGYMWPGPRMGFGRRMGPGFGVGRGLGRGRWFGPGLHAYGAYAAYPGVAGPPQPFTREQELQMLKDQAAELSRQQQEIRQRIEALEEKE